MIVKRNLEKEKKILSQIYANEADTIKYLLFFFKDRAQLRHFFNQFGGKTLRLPDTFEEFLEVCLNNDDLVENTDCKGIDDNIHNQTKNKILETYIRLFSCLEDVIQTECKN